MAKHFELAIRIAYEEPCDETLIRKTLDHAAAFLASAGKLANGELIVEEWEYQISDITEW